MTPKRLVIMAIGFILGALCLVGLYYSHRYFYFRGIDSAKTEISDRTTKPLADASTEFLEIAVQIFRAKNRHPGIFSSKDLHFWQGSLKNWIADVERFAIPLAEKSGDLEEEQRLRQLLTEARTYQEKMAGEK